MTKAGKMLAEVLRSVGKKAATVRYPFVKVTMPADFRGKLKVTFQQEPGAEPEKKPETETKK